MTKEISRKYNLVRRELPLSSFESQVKYDNGNIKEI